MRTFDYDAAMSKEEIYKALILPYLHPYGYLFKYLGLFGCGCPAMVKSGDFVAETREVTRRVREIEGLPTEPPQLTREEWIKALPLFAEAQKLADAAGVYIPNHWRDHEKDL